VFEVAAQKLLTRTIKGDERSIGHQGTYEKLLLPHPIDEIRRIFQHLDTGDKMGKRKMQALAYYQCDYTGLPMRNSNCYIPVWKEDGRMIKQGSFCCWEAVLAATAASPQSKEIKAYIEELVGCELIPAPSHTELSWLSESGTITTIDQFLGACEVPLKPVQVVEVGVDGRLTHCVLARRAWMGFAHRFTTTRKKGKEKAFEVCFGGEGLPNTTATQYFKQALCGPVYVALKSNELAIQERTRYLDLSLEIFSSVFLPRKRKDCAGLEKKEYESVKAEMLQELMQVESTASASALPPSQLAKAAVMPCALGAEMALLYPPDHPPLPRRQVRVH
jgi:hypothetical protein